MLHGYLFHCGVRRFALLIRVISAALLCRRHSAYRRAYPPVIPIAHVAAPDHCFQLFCRVIRTFSAATVKQLVLHSRPHAFAAGIVMTSPSAGLIAFSGVRSSMSGSPFFAACTHPYSAPYGTFSSSQARFTPIFSAGFTDCSL